MDNKTVAQKSGKATASLILGIIGMIAWLIPIIGLPVTIVGLVLGIKSKNSSSPKMAMTGLVLSIIGLVLSTANFSVGFYMGLTGQHTLVNQIKQ